MGVTLSDLISSAEGNSWRALRAQGTQSICGKGDTVAHLCSREGDSTSYQFIILLPVFLLLRVAMRTMCKVPGRVFAQQIIIISLQYFVMCFFGFIINLILITMILNSAKYLIPVDLPQCITLYFTLYIVVCFLNYDAELDIFMHQYFFLGFKLFFQARFPEAELLGQNILTGFDQECQINLQIHSDNFAATSNLKNINFSEALPTMDIAILKMLLLQVNNNNWF